MRGFEFGDSPAHTEIVTQPDQSGVLPYPESDTLLDSNVRALHYEISQGEPSQTTPNNYVENYDAELIIPTISKNDSPSEVELSSRDDAEIEDIYKFINEEQRIDELFAKIVEGVTLNSEGYIESQPITEEEARELKLPAILKSTGDVSQIDKLTRNILSIHASIDTTPVSEASETHDSTAVIHGMSNESLQINPTVWEPAFNYSPPAEFQSNPDSQSDDRPLLNPNGIITKLAQKFGIIGPEPIKKEIIRPTFIQSELDTEEKITDRTREAQHSSADWLEELDLDQLHGSEGDSSEVVELTSTISDELDYFGDDELEDDRTHVSEIRPTAPNNEEDTQVVSRAKDEAELEEFLMQQAEQYFEVEPEKVKPKLVAIPKTLPEQTEPVEPAVAIAEEPIKAESKNVDSQIPEDKSETTPSVEIRRRALRGLKDLYRAKPLEIVSVAASETLNGQGKNLAFQMAIDRYNKEYSIDTIWKMYCDGDIRADGTIMSPQQQDIFNKLLIDSLERIDDSQFEFVA